MACLLQFLKHDSPEIVIFIIKLAAKKCSNKSGENGYENDQGFLFLINMMMFTSSTPMAAPMVKRVTI